MVNICKTTNNVGSIKMHGYLSDGSYYKTGDLMCSDHEDSILLGRAFGSEEAEFLDTNSGSAKRGCFWVKAKIGQHYLVSHGKGFEVWNSFLNMAERK